MVSVIGEIRAPSVTLRQGGYEVGVDFVQVNRPDLAAWGACLTWLHVDPYPTEQQMVDWENARLADIASKDAAREAALGLSEKKSLAEGLATEITSTFNLVLGQTEGNVDLTTRYATLRAHMDAQVGVFKNRFNNDLLYEAEVVAATIVSDSDKSKYCKYLREWITTLTVLLKSNF